MVDLGHYKLHIDHCSVSCHVLIHSRNNLRTSLFSWMNLKASRILFRFLVFGLVAEFFPHCILSLFLQMDQIFLFGPKCTVMCYVLKPPHLYSRRSVYCFKGFMGAHIWQRNKQTNHNWIWSTKHKWNLKKSKIWIFKTFNLGWYFGLTNQVNHHAY